MRPAYKLLYSCQATIVNVNCSLSRAKKLRQSRRSDEHVRRLRSKQLAVTHENKENMKSIDIWVIKGVTKWKKYCNNRCILSD